MELLAKAVLIANRTIAEREKRISALEDQITVDRPMTELGRAVDGSIDSISISNMAKLLKQNGIETGEKRFFTWLRDNGYLINRKGVDKNMPTQHSMELGLFEIKETPYRDCRGQDRLSRKSLVTGKGQTYFVNKFLSGGLPC